MLVLGIECTAHTFGVGIVDCKNKQVLFSEKSLFQNDVGMDPRKLSDFHVANFDKIIIQAKQFLKTQNKNFSDLDLIAFSQGPGIGNSLKIGALVAKTLALKYNIKIIGVNHIRAHLEIGKMFTGFSDPMFLNITGVNSQVIAKDEFGKYKVYGETEDIGLGNLFDSCARDFGLGFPGGAKIEEKAKSAKKYIEFPYTIKGMNVSLAGIQSFVKQQLKKGENVEDLSYSLQETVFAMLMEIAERALAYTKKKELVIVGGVAANRRFVEMAKEMCKIRGAKYDTIPLKYCMDNGAMIAWQGYIVWSKAKKDKKRKIGDIMGLKPMPYINVESKL